MTTTAARVALAAAVAAGLPRRAAAAGLEGGLFDDDGMVAGIVVGAAVLAVVVGACALAHFVGFRVVAGRATAWLPARLRPWWRDQLARLR